MNGKKKKKTHRFSDFHCPTIFSSGRRNPRRRRRRIKEEDQEEEKEREEEEEQEEEEKEDLFGFLQLHLLCISQGPYAQ